MQSILDTAETKRNHQLDDNSSTRATRKYRDKKTMKEPNEATVSDIKLLKEAHFGSDWQQGI